MARVKRSVHGRKHHRAVLEQAKGYYGNKSRSYRAANEQLMHSMQYAYRDRRARKGDFRKLWIQRINAGARQHGMSYSRLINGLHLAGVEVDRKVLADLAVSDPEAFGALVATAQDALSQRARGRGRFLTQRLAFTHRRVRRLRGLLQKRSARWAERAFVAEGAELIRCALDAGRARRVGLRLARRRSTTGPPRRSAGGPTAAGARVFPLAAGVLERVADTVTPQPVLAVLPMLEEPAPGRDVWQARPGSLLVVLVDVRDPGNAGTVLRAADASGSTRGRLRRRLGRPLQPQDGARLGRLALPRPPRRAARPGARWPTELSAAGFRTLGHGRARRRGLRRARLVGAHGALPRQRVRRARPRRCATRSTGRSPSRWPGGPSRSTWAWPAPSSASRRSASAGVAGPGHVASRGGGKARHGD